MSFRQFMLGAMLLTSSMTVWAEPEAASTTATPVAAEAAAAPEATPAAAPTVVEAPAATVEVQADGTVTTTVAPPTTTVVTSAPAAVAEAPEAAPAAAPVPNEGNVTWMLVSTILVIFMSLPGLALFYGGMARSKNMLSVLMQVFTIFSLIAVLWVIYGYSVAFSDGNPFFGGLNKLFLKGVIFDDAGAFVNTGTFSRGVVIPELLFAMFQLTFAAITCALIAGGYAERMKFSAILIFTVVWFSLSYLPMAHMVWWWAGPDSYAAAGANVDALNASAGKIWQWGALDFAGGTVVHINAGVAGLVAAIMVGKRLGYGKVAMPPHSLTMTMIGGSMLWVGWFGFNAGSNLEANGYAVLALANTIFAAAVGALVWLSAEWLHKGKPSLLGAISGAIAGLVGITPACGFVGPLGALVIGVLCGLVCFWSVTWLKVKLGYDDALDAFGVHAIGGILGAILTGVFVNPDLGGTSYATDWAAKDAVAFGYAFTQIWIQVKGVLVATFWSGTVSFVTLFILDKTIGLRVSEDAEREGLDLAEHGERAYNN